MVILMDAQRRYIDQAAVAGAAGGRVRSAGNANSRYQRKGTETIAGVKCDVWEEQARAQGERLHQSRMG
jgi:hypothetical protein